MSDDIKMKWRFKAFAELRSMPELERRIDDSLEAMAAEAGDGFIANVENRKGGIRGSVVAAGPQARRRNARDNILISKFAAGRIR